MVQRRSMSHRLTAKFAWNQLVCVSIWCFWMVMLLSCLKQRLNVHDLSEQKNGQHSPMNCSKIGNSYEAFTHLFGRNISIYLLSANKGFCWSFEIGSNGRFRNNLRFWDSFTLLLITKDRQKSFLLRREEEWSCFDQTGRQMLSHKADQS